MLALVFTFLLFGVARSQECDTIKTDECGVKILEFLLDPSKIPANEAELQEICRIVQEGEACIRDYVAKCPNAAKKEAIDAFLESVVRTFEDVCSGNLGKRLLPHGACLQEKLVKDFPACSDETTKLAEAVAVSEPVADRLKHLCCVYLNLDKCLADSSKAVCDERASRVVRNIVQSVALFMVDKCLPFLSSPETCDLSAFKDAPPNARNPKTFVPGLIDIVAAVF